MFNDVYAGKRVLVTGHMGFKGSWLVVWLRRLGAEVIGFSDRAPSDPSMFARLGLANLVEHHVGDVRDGAAVRALVEAAKPDAVFHLAAQPIVRASYEDPVGTIETNVMGTANVLDALRLAGRPCTAVMVTSDKCYENVEWTYGYRETDAVGGKDPYSASKGAAEVVIHAFACSYFLAEGSPVRVASARAGNVIGGGDWAANRLVPDCVRAWSKGEPVEIRRPAATRPWQHVLEPLGGYLALGAALAEEGALTESLNQSLNHSLNGESFNFGPPAESDYSVGALLEALAARWPDLGTERLILAEDPGVHEAGLLKLNCDKALHRLRWKPVYSFEETVAVTAEWYVKSGLESADLLSLTEAQIDAYCTRAKELGLGWAT